MAVAILASVFCARR